MFFLFLPAVKNIKRGTQTMNLWTKYWIHHRKEGKLHDVPKMLNKCNVTLKMSLIAGDLDTKCC